MSIPSLFSGISDAWRAFTGGDEHGATTDDQHGGDQEDEEAPLAGECCRSLPALYESSRAERIPDTNVATSLVVCWLADNDLMLVLPAPVPEGEGKTQLS